MDAGATAGIVTAFLFGGVAFVYGGYSLEHDHRFWAVLSYVTGGACIVAAVMLAFYLPTRQSNHEIINAASPMTIPLTTRSQITAQPTSTAIPNENLSAAYLIEMQRNKTEAQLARLVKNYVGRTLKVQGRIYDVKVRNNGEAISLAQPPLKVM